MNSRPARRFDPVRLLLAAVALTSVAALALIALFIFLEGAPLVLRVGPRAFLLGDIWSPAQGKFGIRPMIAGSFWVTALSLLFAVPFAFACAIHLAEFAAPRARAFLKPAIELLAGVPSVVYGFLGVTTIVPAVRNTFGGSGFSVLGCAIVLAVMTLPTIASVAYDALRAVPDTVRHASLALGATRWQTARRAVLPAAAPGLVAAVILGMGRAVGETMAVIMVAGNALIVPGSPLDPVRTLTSHVALEMGYATGAHREALFATGCVLFLIVMMLNAAAGAAVSRAVGRR